MVVEICGSIRNPKMQIMGSRKPVSGRTASHDLLRGLQFECPLPALNFFCLLLQKPLCLRPCIEPQNISPEIPDPLMNVIRLLDGNNGFSQSALFSSWIIIKTLASYFTSFLSDFSVNARSLPHPRSIRCSYWLCVIP